MTDKKKDYPVLTPCKLCNPTFGQCYTSKGCATALKIMKERMEQ